jgi:hypothetical protein
MKVSSNLSTVLLFLYYCNVNKTPYATMFGARFYCALTLHVSAPIGGDLQVVCDKIYSQVATIRIYFVT